MLSKSPSRPKSETVIGGGLCPDTWATAFNDSYVGTCRSCAFGHKRSLAHCEHLSVLAHEKKKPSRAPDVALCLMQGHTLNITFVML